MKTILFLMAFLSLGTFAQSWGGGPSHLVFSCTGYDQDLHDQFYLSRSQQSLLVLKNRDNGRDDYFRIIETFPASAQVQALSPEMAQMQNSDDYHYFTGSSEKRIFFPGGGSINFYLYVAKDDRRLSHMYIIKTQWDGTMAKHTTEIESEYVFNCAKALR